jgi:three-Cys-motif partner protein
MALQQFGGDWTADKLERLRKYLAAYVQIMKKRRFRFAYIDAFAGTGYVERPKKVKNAGVPLLPAVDDASREAFGAFAEAESQEFLDGSARIALRIEPRFDRYIFVERDLERCAELERLKGEFPDRGADIKVVNQDANTYLRQLCGLNWDKSRAVLFLDPFGMAVEWSTVEAIAKTRAIDLWYLFPLGVAVNRLLKRDGQISEGWSRRLDLVFGTHGWYDAFYQVTTQADLFGTTAAETSKVAEFHHITEFFVERLCSVFGQKSVATNPLPLYSSCNTPLFLLCFACGNPNAAKVAVKIAQDILQG